MPNPIYLDYNATTPIAPEVVDAMLPYLREYWGNPSSSHTYGRQAREGVVRAREQVANLLGAAADEIVFTGGGTESNNQALRGVLRSNSRRKLVISSVEHPAIANVADFLTREYGVEVVILPVDRHGVVDLAVAEAAIDDRTALVSVMHANNEIGSLQPIAELADIAHAHGALMHTDAAQSVGKVPVRVDELHVDLLSLAGHKFYAPKGVGALYISNGVSLPPLLIGAGHEGGRRAGTENVPYMVGMGEAARLATERLSTEGARIAALRDSFEEGLKHIFPRLVVNGAAAMRLPNTAHVSFVGKSGADVLASIPEIAASTGAACKADSDEPSGILAAMGADLERARGAVRFSLGRYTTTADVEKALALISAHSR